MSLRVLGITKNRKGDQAMNATPLAFTISLAAACACVSAQEKPLVISHEDPGLEWMPCPDFIPEGCQIAVLQGDPADTNLDIFFKVPGDFEIPPHFHTSQERMVLVSGTLEVVYENHEKETISVGEYAYGPAELPHSAYCHAGADCVLYIGFVAPLDAIPIEGIND
ncbi:MAG: cupin domain-containing protein [Pseudomonadota bacterium]|nr:cupin domain-containing protein [Pseudomonadota bacterium]